ncbi:MAG: transcriptional regulator [Thermoanaerobaculia bacterium]|nr:transcriptional regulator [Thermoanaerobaculia bacterium]
MDASFTPDPSSGQSAGLPGLVRAADLEARGIPRGRLALMLRRGEVERVARGVYRLHDAPLSELETVAAVSKRIPGAIVCLLTALHIHGIGTQAPRAVWIAIDRKARKPVAPRLPLRIVRFSGAMLNYGIETRQVLGVLVRLTSPARTVVDCFRYRNKLGLDVALEALRDALGSRVATIAEITRAAEVCRAETVIVPYLETLA